MLWFGLGRTLLELRSDLNERLKEFVVKPHVTVDVLEYRSQRCFVLGAVRRPGAFPVDGTRTLLESIGLAGGIGVVSSHPLVEIIATTAIRRCDRAFLMAWFSGIERAAYPEVRYLPTPQ